MEVGRGVVENSVAHDGEETARVEGGRNVLMVETDRNDGVDVVSIRWSITAGNSISSSTAPAFNGLRCPVPRTSSFRVTPEVGQHQRLGVVGIVFTSKLLQKVVEPERGVRLLDQRNGVQRVAPPTIPHGHHVATLAAGPRD